MHVFLLGYALIRTSAEAWKSSKEILKIVLDSISTVKKLNELKLCLETKTSKSLRDYSEEHGDEAHDISVNQVDNLALKQMMNQKDLQKIETIVHEFGKLQEKVSKEIMTKYPAFVFPKSLLPYPKEKVQKALEGALRYINDDQMIKNIKICAVFLENFINDDEANEKNETMLKVAATRENIRETVNINQKSEGKKFHNNPSQKRYKVLVDDNFHYQDASERYELNQYDIKEEAIEACKKNRR